jgi:hypothetical protein
MGTDTKEREKEMPVNGSCGGQLALRAPKLRPINTRLKSLSELLEEYQTGQLQTPPHQRKERWKPDKQHNYIERLHSAVPPPGSFETYQLKGKETPIWLNDGNNRLHSLELYMENSTAYGDTKEQAIELVKSCEVAVGHKHYKNHPEAHIDFILVNAGTMATPYEQCQGLLLYMGDGTSSNLYKKVWEHLHDGVHQIAMRVVARPANNEILRQKYKRHDIGLLYRFLSGDVSKSNYYVSRKHIPIMDIQEKRIIEWRLIELLDDYNSTEIIEQIDKFISFLAHETATIQAVWSQLDFDDGWAIRFAAYRWLLDVAIWKRHTKKTNAEWLKFLEHFLRATKGNGQVPNPYDERSYQTLTLSDLGKLTRVCNLLELPEFHEIVPQRNHISNKCIQLGLDI